MISPIKELRPGEIITAAWCNAIVRQLRAICPQSSGDVNVNTQPGGTTFNLRRISRGTASEKPPFLVFDASTGGDSPAAQVKVTGGVINYPYNDVQITVDDSDAIAVSDGDYVFLKMTDDLTWEFAADSSLPSDMLYFILADNIAVSDDAITDITLDWSGGSLTFPEIFPVSLATDGGSGGGNGDVADFTYKVTTLGGVDILTEATPVIQPAARLIPTAEVTAATQGTARILVDGTFQLWDCDEQQTLTFSQSKTTDCETG